MGVKHTFEQAEEVVKNKGFELVREEYINNRSYLIIKDKDGYLANVLFGNVNNKKYKRFDKIGVSNHFTIQNINLWIALNKKPFVLISDKFEGDKKKLKWLCKKEDCGEIFELSWNSIINNRGCGYCAGQLVGLSNCLATKFPELVKEWHPTKNGDLTPLDVTVCYTKRIWWQCKENPKHEWEVSVASRTSKGGTGCPICKNSKGETRIYNYLNVVNIFSYYEHAFSNCRYKIPLPFDVYLPYFNVCIEYQGEHHYFPVDFGNKGLKYAEHQFEERKIKDQIKRDYCKDNNIKLIEIPYWEFDSIEEILDKELNINKFTTDNVCCFL